MSNNVTPIPTPLMDTFIRAQDAAQAATEEAVIGAVAEAILKSARRHAWEASHKGIASRDVVAAASSQTLTLAADIAAALSRVLPEFNPTGFFEACGLSDGGNK